MIFEKNSKSQILDFLVFKQFLNIPSEEECVKRLLQLNRLIRIFYSRLQDCIYREPATLQGCRVCTDAFLQPYSGICHCHPSLVLIDLIFRFFFA